MYQTESLDAAIRQLIVDLCKVLHQHGYHEISIGALMRVIGVDADRAAEHDSKVIDLNEHFQTGACHPNHKIPPGTTLH